MQHIFSIEVLAVLIGLLLLAVLVLYWKLHSLSKRLNTSIKLINDLYQVSQKQKASQEDLMSGLASDSEVEKLAANLQEMKQESHNEIQDIKTEINKLQNQTDQLIQQDPELKMYSKANQLLMNGASMDDVIEASGLPRAEVEVLAGLQRKKK